MGSTDDFFAPIEHVRGPTQLERLRDEGYVDTYLSSEQIRRMAPSQLERLAAHTLQHQLRQRSKKPNKFLQKYGYNGLSAIRRTLQSTA